MAQRPQQRQPQPSGRRGLIIIWASIAAFAMLFFALPTVIILIGGMLPTLVAFIIDQDRERYATFCVASMNICGVFPYLLDLWIGEHTVIAAFQSLTDVFALFLILGAAAFGWVIFTAVPPVISSFLSVVAQSRVTALRTEQRKLIEEWGEAVAAHVEGAAQALKASAAKSRAAKQAANQAGNTGKPPTAPAAPTAPGQNAGQNTGQAAGPDASTKTANGEPAAGQPA